MLNADAAHGVLLLAAEFVEVIVDLVQRVVLIEVVLQVFQRGTLAGRFADACHNQVAQYVVLYLIEAYQVVHLIKDNPCAVVIYEVDVVQYSPRLLPLIKAELHGERIRVKPYPIPALLT